MTRPRHPLAVLGALLGTLLGPASTVAPFAATSSIALAGALVGAPAHATGTLGATLSGVRPEALSWLWDNADEALLRAANAELQSFEWVTPPATPQDLGYSTGAAFRSSARFAGALHSVAVTYLDPQVVRSQVASDNYLGRKPYSFLAAAVRIDGGAPFQLLVQYTPTGSGYGDTALRIDVSQAANPALAQAYAAHLLRTLQGLQSTVMDALNERYFNAVLKTHGTYTVGPVDKKLNVTLTIVQNIRGITPDMLSWWWDHIGNTARYRLWQPIDHVSFEWLVPPTMPDMLYDVGAEQKAKEYIGKLAMTLSITGADPVALPPPVPLTEPGYFYASTNVLLLKGLLPDNSLVHQWRMNDTGDGVILTSTFVNTALVMILNKNFFQDLGSHCLREFQMLPSFLPRLYRREQLGE